MVLEESTATTLNMSSMPSFDVFNVVENNESIVKPNNNNEKNDNNNNLMNEGAGVDDGVMLPPHKRSHAEDEDEATTIADEKEVPVKKKAKTSEDEPGFAEFRAQEYVTLESEGCIHERCFPPDVTHGEQYSPSLRDGDGDGDGGCDGDER